MAELQRKKIKCEICGKEFENYKSLARHFKVHKITSKEYYDKFLKREDEGICPVCGKETNFKNIRDGYCKFCSNKCAKSGKNNSMFGKRGERNPLYGKHRSEETKKKISKSKRGKNNPMFGKHHTEETKKKLSDANKGENNPNFGKHHSEETKQKMSDAKKDLSEEARKKISDAKKGENNPNFGKHRSEETKKKISKANKGKLAGKNHPNYKGGISLKEFKDTHGLEPEEWKKLAQQIRIRDEFTCQYCGKKNATSVHHIIPRRIRIDNSPDNLITLCRSCHAKIERLTDKYLAEGKDPMEIFYEKWQE